MFGQLSRWRMLKATGEVAVIVLGVSVICSCQKIQTVRLVTTAAILLLTMSSWPLGRARRADSVPNTSKTKGKRGNAATVDALLPIMVGATVWQLHCILSMPDLCVPFLYLHRTALQTARVHQTTVCGGRTHLWLLWAFSCQAISDA